MFNKKPGKRMTFFAFFPFTIEISENVCYNTKKREV